MDPQIGDAAFARGCDQGALLAAGRLAGDQPGSNPLQPDRHRLARIRDPLDPRRIGGTKVEPILGDIDPNNQLATWY